MYHQTFRSKGPSYLLPLTLFFEVLFFIITAIAVVVHADRFFNSLPGLFVAIFSFSDFLLMIILVVCAKLDTNWEITGSIFIFSCLGAAQGANTIWLMLSAPFSLPDYFLSLVGAGTIWVIRLIVHFVFINCGPCEELAKTNW